MNKKNIFKFVCVVIIILFGTAPPAWPSSIGVSVVDSQGNTNTQTISVHADHEFEQDRSSQEIKGNFLYAETDNKRTGESWDLSGKDSHYSETDWGGITGLRGYVFNLIGVGANEFSGIDFESSFSLGVGVNLKNEILDLKLEAGPSLIYEERPDGDQGFVTSRVYESFTWQITDRISFSESAEYIRPYENPEDYRVNGGFDFTGKVTDYISVKFGPRAEYVNKPPVDEDGKELKKTDIITSATIVFSF
jgi:putative salt-induced outer membrane protein YdiY